MWIGVPLPAFTSDPELSAPEQVVMHAKAATAMLPSAMTQEDAVAHWRQGARDAMEVAELSFQAGKYSLALFHCHLATEKAFKAAFIGSRDAAPPPTHSLLLLAEKAGLDLTLTQQADLKDLTRFVIEARYDDPGWAEHEATHERVAIWLRKTKEFVSLVDDGQE